MFRLVNYHIKYADEPGPPQVEPAHSAEQAVRFFARSTGYPCGKRIYVWTPDMISRGTAPYRYVLRNF